MHIAFFFSHSCTYFQILQKSPYLCIFLHFLRILPQFFSAFFWCFKSLVPHRRYPGSTNTAPACGRLLSGGECGVPFANYFGRPSSRTMQLPALQCSSGNRSPQNHTMHWKFGVQPLYNSLDDCKYDTRRHAAQFLTLFFCTCVLYLQSIFSIRFSFFLLLYVDVHLFVAVSFFEGVHSHSPPPIRPRHGRVIFCGVARPSPNRGGQHGARRHNPRHTTGVCGV